MEFSKEELKIILQSLIDREHDLFEAVRKEYVRYDKAPLKVELRQLSKLIDKIETKQSRFEKE